MRKHRKSAFFSQFFKFAIKFPTMWPSSSHRHLTQNTTIKDNGFDFYGGIGANYAVSDDILAQGEYTFYSYGGDSFDDSAHALLGSLALLTVLSS